MHVLGRGDQYGIRRNRLLEKEVVILEALRCVEPEFFGNGLAADRIQLYDSDEFEPFGMPDGIFQILVGAVPCSDGYDRNRSRT